MNDGALVSRRNFLRASAGAAGVTAASTATDYGPVGDSEAAIVSASIAGAAIAGAALGYAINEGVEYVTGDDTGNLTGTEEAADLHTEIRARGRSMFAADDTVTTTLQNRLNDSRNVAWSKAKKEATKSFNNSNAKSAVKTDASDAVSSYYVVMQKNLVNHWVEQVNKLENMYGLIDSADNSLTPDEVGFVESPDEGTTDVAGFPGGDIRQYETKLVDGNNFTYRNWLHSSIGSGSSHYVVDPFKAHTGDKLSNEPYNRTRDGQVYVNPVDTGSSVQVHDAWYFASLWDGIIDAHDQMVTNVQQYVEDLFSNYSPGDIDPSQYLDPTTLASELSTDYSSTGYHAYAAAEAAVMGVPGTIDTAMTISLQGAGITVNGSLWTDWEPSNDDGSTGFKAGTTYDPVNTQKDVFISYEYTGDKFIPSADQFLKNDSGEWMKESINDTSEFNTTSSNTADGDLVQVGFQQLSEPFIIESAVNQDTGEQVTTVQPESKNNQTSDVNLTQEELQQLLDYREQIRTNEDTGGGGSGGFDFGGFGFAGIPGEGVALGAVAVIAWLMND
jgi:hypothetical protein